MTNTYVAIMAGGVGSRFWPMSREAQPKQFLDMMNNGQSLIALTFERFAKIVPKQNIYIVTSDRYVEQIKEHIPAITDNQILAEPSRRNTAPCVAYVSYKIHNLDPNANIVVAPSDHLIKDETSFANTINLGVDYVSNHDDLVTLGIRPEWPNTGYGYIQHDEKEVVNSVYPVKTFTEKPDLDLAKKFLKSGDFLWNSGMFIWNSKTIIKAFRSYLPEMADLFDEMQADFNTKKEKEGIANAYYQCKNISIDYGIMEKAENVYVIPSSFGWCDLGTWSSLWEESDKDYFKNAVIGDNVMVYDASNNLVAVPKKKLVIIEGLEDFVVVDTDDVLMICKKQSEQRIKEINSDVRREKGDKYL